MTIKYVDSGESIDGLSLTYAVHPHPVIDPAQAKLESLRAGLAAASGELSSSNQRGGLPGAIRETLTDLRQQLTDLDRLINALPATWLHPYREGQARLLREGRESVSRDLLSLEACIAANSRSSRSGTPDRWQETFQKIDIGATDPSNSSEK